MRDATHSMKSKKKKRIAVLTGGGDCPGLNMVLWAISQECMARGWEVWGIEQGWWGFLNQKAFLLNPMRVESHKFDGGTLLGASRWNPLKEPAGIDRCYQYFKKMNFEALIAIGGDGTLQVSTACLKKGMPVVAVPKTIDNDTWGTDYTVGFMTAVETAVQAMDRLRTTASSHHEIMIVEMMGRRAGWLTAYAGIAGGAHEILVPEEKVDLTTLTKRLQKHLATHHHALVALSEDADMRLPDGKRLHSQKETDEFGDARLMGMGQALAVYLKKQMKATIRSTVLGHVQRGGTPGAWDRYWAYAFGVKAVSLVEEKKWGELVIHTDGRLKTMPMKKACDRMRGLDKETLQGVRRYLQSR